MTTLRAIVVTLRPRQWVKNAFVIAPLVFSKHLFDGSYALRAIIAMGAFCALSGAVYAFNNLRDVEQDRAHPLKRHRPIAAGALSETAALATAAILAIGALAVCGLLAMELLLIGAAYAAINLTYSLGLKRIAFVDVLLISAGFLLRVSGGAHAIAVPVSPWLLACTALLASMLGFGKRAHELHLAGDAATETRAALAGYSPRVLRWAMYLLAFATMASYALYTQNERTVSFFGTRALIWTLPFCVLGIARFLQHALWRPRQESPTDAILRDVPFLANLLLWGVCVLTIIYSAG